MSDDEWCKEKKSVARKWLVDNMDAIVDEMYFSLPKEPYQLNTYRLDEFDVYDGSLWDMSFWPFVGHGGLSIRMHENEIREMIFDLAMNMNDQDKMLETLTKAYGRILIEKAAKEKQ